MKGIIKGLTGSVLFPLWFTCAGSWQEFLLFLEEAAFSKSAVFMVKIQNFYGFHYKEYFSIINFTQKYVIFPSHHYLQLRKLKWWSLLEKLVWVYLWSSQICCSYRHFRVSFKPSPLVLPAVRRLLTFSCDSCNPPKIWCCKYGSTSRTWGNTGCSLTTACVPPVGLRMFSFWKLRGQTTRRDSLPMACSQNSESLGAPLANGPDSHRENWPWPGLGSEGHSDYTYVTSQLSNVKSAVFPETATPYYYQSGFRHLKPTKWTLWAKISFGENRSCLESQG